MERLTNKREADAQREEYERRLANGYPRNIPEERFLRLAAYEDTRLEPEEVLPKDKADEIALKLMRLADLESICSYTRLRELAEADRAGRLVVLPCEVGTATYYIHYPIAVYPDKSEPEIKRGIFTLCDLDRVGRSVFLTREEAEKALEAMKDE
jgi:hypothetical protein